MKALALSSSSPIKPPKESLNQEELGEHTIHKGKGVGMVLGVVCPLHHLCLYTELITNCHMVFSRAGHACFMRPFTMFREKPTACRVQHTGPMHIVTVKLLLAPCTPGCSAPLQGCLLRAGPTILLPPHGSLTWVASFQVVA